MDRHQIIDQDRPRRARAYGGDPFQISFARLAHLDPARLLALLGREVGEVVVLDLVAEYAPQQRDRPSGAAAATAQLALALEPRVLGHHGPGPAHRTVPFPPAGRDLRREAAGTGLQQRHGRHLSHDADRLRVGAGGRGERVTARVVLAHRRREQGEPIHVPPAAVHLRSEVEEAAHPGADRPTVHPHLSATQQRRLDGAVRRNRRQGGLPTGAILAFVERCLQQPEPRLCLGVVAAGLGQPLLDRYVPRAPGTGEGPEHCTFTVRQGVR